MVGPNPLAYSCEPSGENFTAPNSPPDCGSRPLTSRSRSTGSPAPARQRATRPGDWSPVDAASAANRDPSRRVLDVCRRPVQALVGLHARAAPVADIERCYSAGSRSGNRQGSDVSLNATAPVTGSTADVTINLTNGEYSRSCDLFSRSNRRTSWSLSITDARVPSSASDMLAAPTPSSWMRMMLVRRGALEKTRARLTRVSELSQSWMASTASSSARSNSGSSSASAAMRRASATVARSPARFAWNPAMRPAVTATIARPAAPADHPGQSRTMRRSLRS